MRPHSHTDTFTLINLSFIPIPKMLYDIPITYVLINCPYLFCQFPTHVSFTPRTSKINERLLQTFDTQEIVFETYFHLGTRLSQHLYVITSEDCFLACSIVVRQLELVADNREIQLQDVNINHDVKMASKWRGISIHGHNTPFFTSSLKFTS